MPSFKDKPSLSPPAPPSSVLSRAERASRMVSVKPTSCKYCRSICRPPAHKSLSGCWTWTSLSSFSASFCSKHKRKTGLKNKTVFKIEFHCKTSIENCGSSRKNGSYLLFASHHFQAVSVRARARGLLIFELEFFDVKVLLFLSFSRISLVFM